MYRLHYLLLQHPRLHLRSFSFPEKLTHVQHILFRLLQFFHPVLLLRYHRYLFQPEHYLLHHLFQLRFQELYAHLLYVRLSHYVRYLRLPKHNRLLHLRYGRFCQYFSQYILLPLFPEVLHPDLHQNLHNKYLC